MTSGRKTQMSGSTVFGKARIEYMKLHSYSKLNFISINFLESVSVSLQLTLINEKPDQVNTSTG